MAPIKVISTAPVTSPTPGTLPKMLVSNPGNKLLTCESISLMAPWTKCRTTTWLKSLTTSRMQAQYLSTVSIAMTWNRSSTIYSGTCRTSTEKLRWHTSATSWISWEWARISATEGVKSRSSSIGTWNLRTEFHGSRPDTVRTLLSTMLALKWNGSCRIQKRLLTHWNWRKRSSRRLRSERGEKPGKRITFTIEEQVEECPRNSSNNVERARVKDPV